MPGDRVQFDPEDAERILRTLQRVEGWPVNDPPPPPPPSVGTQIWNVYVRVSSATPTSGRYPAQIQNYDVDAKAWTDFGICWAVGPNGESLTTGLYFGRFQGVLASDGKAVFVVATDGQMAFVKPVVATPDGSGRYDALIQLQDTGTLAWSDGPACWLIEANAAAKLVSGNRYLARFLGTNNGRPAYVCEDFDLTVTDNFSSTDYNRVRRILFDATPTAYDPSKGDWIFSLDATTRELTIRLNGVTGDGIFYHTVCVAGVTTDFIATVHVSNGLVKSGWPLDSSYYV